jgi:uncharacterized protein YjaZ
MELELEMGIIRTDQWLQKEFDRPERICERLAPYFKTQSAHKVYKELLNFGMYQPSRLSWYSYEKMVDDEMWSTMNKIYQSYSQKWSGPDIPVFLFPLDQNGGFFRKAERTKSGVSFRDKMFLFLSPDVDEKEAEALFVHEYHHICRLNKLKGNVHEYSLLDSIVIEGLAEYAVLKNCGKNYLADWCTMYSERQIGQFWERFLKKNLSVTKKESLHDELLYGHGRYPKLVGYAAGFSIVSEYYKDHSYSIKKSFILPAGNFLKGTKYDPKE